ELELKAEITRAKAALESEAHRSSALAKDLAKVSRNFESSQAEAEAARRQGQDREKELTAQFAKAHRAFGEVQEKVGRLEAEIAGLRKRAGKAGELNGKESELKAQMAKLEAGSKELAERETALAGGEARVRQREGEALKATRPSAEGTLGGETALKPIKDRKGAPGRRRRKMRKTEEKPRERKKAGDE